MNSKRISTLICATLMTALLAVPASATTYQDWQDAVVSGADYLLQFQNDDGGFPWKVTNPDPLTYDSTKGSPANTLGATARGLVAAYNVTGDSTYLSAANAVADLIEYRYDNNVNIGSYGPPFYNKDVEFAYELAAAGGKDITAKANDSAVAYFNAKLADYAGDPTVTTAAQAIYQRYVDSGWATPGAQFWMIGDWVSVASHLGSEEIYTGYTGTMLAAELYSLMEAGYGTYFDPDNDIYAGIGLYGTLEGAYFGQGDAGNTGALEEVKSRLNDPANYFDYQDLGYNTFMLGLLGDPAATTGSSILVDWQNDDGAWIYGSGSWYGEVQGEALLGMANNAVTPEPASFAIWGLLTVIGLAVAGRRRR